MRKDYFVVDFEFTQYTKDGYWHTAYDDAINTSKILLKLIDDGWKPEHSFA